MSDTERPTPPDAAPAPPATAAAAAPATTPAAPQPKPARTDDLVRAGWFDWQVPATVGATTLVIACVLGVVYAQQSSRMTTTPRLGTLDAILWTLLGGPAIILLGVVALWIGAKAAGRHVGDKRLGAARIAAAVGVAALVWSIGPFVVKIAPVEWILSVLVYLVVLWSLFRMPRKTLLIVAVAHLVLSAALILTIAYALPRIT